MPKFLKVLLSSLAILIIAAAWPGYKIYQEVQKSRSEDPLVWEADIKALEAASRETPPARNAVLFVGSSSIRLWQNLAEDMQPIPVIQHGFGGAKLNDVVHYCERLINAYQPAAVVIFAGTNDLRPGATKAPTVLLDSYQALVTRIRADLPDTPIYFIGITPSPLRWEVWPEAQQTNGLIQRYSQGLAQLEYIETGPALLGEDGSPNRDNYRWDGLHLSAAGYRLWTSIIRERLLADLPEFSEREPGSASLL